MRNHFRCPQGKKGKKREEKGRYFGCASPKKKKKRGAYADKRSEGRKNTEAEKEKVDCLFVRRREKERKKESGGGGCYISADLHKKEDKRKC